MRSFSTRLDALYTTSKPCDFRSYLNNLLTLHSDDPWNQTAADNAQWLRQFKRDVGILIDPDADPNEANLSGLYI